MFDWKGSIRRRSSEAMGWPIPFGTRAQAFKAWIVFSLPKRVLFREKDKNRGVFGCPRIGAHGATHEVSFHTISIRLHNDPQSDRIHLHGNRFFGHDGQSAHKRTERPRSGSAVVFGRQLYGLDGYSSSA